MQPALKSAEAQSKVQRNVHRLVENKPKHQEGTRIDDDGNTEAYDEIQERCWEAGEARKFLKAARKAGPQQAAFYSMLLELGSRKGEICGLRWNVNLDGGKVTIARQLV
ncbi:MAG: hypothetical protein ACRD1X_08740, partial [Vicinamibacteria bacterium]